MKKNSRNSAARILAGLPFVLTSLFLLFFSAMDLSATARNRTVSQKGISTKGTVSPALPSVPVAFSGTYDPHVFPCGTPLNHFTVLPGQARIVVQVSATIATNDLTVTLLYGAINPVPVAGPEDEATSSELLL